jgi:hypothetical protein
LNSGSGRGAIFAAAQAGQSACRPSTMPRGWRSNRREELEEYLKQHPDGHFADLARARLASLEMN